MILLVSGWIRQNQCHRKLNETILKYPEFFYAGEASMGTECSQSLALVLVPMDEAVPNVEDKSDTELCIE